MAQTSTIEWTESTWNPVVGCTRVSAGCKHCYAERMAKRLAAMARADERAGRDPGRKRNYLNVLDNHGRWNGQISLDHSALEAPYHWAQPRIVFVNSMSDLFHPGVPEQFIRDTFRVMSDCGRHTFQILTKRPERAAAMSDQLIWSPNIWMGTSVEDALVRDRVRNLGRTGAHTRFLSVEPLLGPIPRLMLSGIHWVIVGGESGPSARPMQIEWVRQIRDRCIAQNVAFFFKQWGGVNKKATGRMLDGRTWDEMPHKATNGGSRDFDVRAG